MTPEFSSRMRKSLPRIFLVGLLLIWAALGWKIIYGDGLYIPPLISELVEFRSRVIPVYPEYEPVSEPEDEWLYVNRNNVLLWPMVGGKCTRRSALMQMNKGEKVLVIERHDALVEVELNNQSRLHTHGCIHETMLSNEDG